MRWQSPACAPPGGVSSASVACVPVAFGLRTRAFSTVGPLNARPARAGAGGHPQIQRKNRQSRTRRARLDTVQSAWALAERRALRHPSDDVAAERIRPDHPSHRRMHRARARRRVAHRDRQEVFTFRCSDGTRLHRAMVGVRRCRLAARNSLVRVEYRVAQPALGRMPAHHEARVEHRSTAAREWARTTVNDDERQPPTVVRGPTDFFTKSSASPWRFICV